MLPPYKACATEIISDLKGVIFLNPETSAWETADAYLSGNIRNKLAAAKSAAESNPDFTENVSALEAAMPDRIEAGDITAKLGSPWIDDKYIQEFMYELFETPKFYRDLGIDNNYIGIQHNPATAKWNVMNKSLDKDNIKSNTAYGTSRKSGYSIFEDSLNMVDTTVYHADTAADALAVSISEKAGVDLDFMSELMDGNDGKIFYRENSIMTEMPFTGKRYERVSGIAAISKCVRELLNMQLEGYSDEAIISKRTELNQLYDDFTKKNGLLNDKTNRDIFREDVSLPLVLSLEKVKDGKLIGKADIFTKRTLQPPVRLSGGFCNNRLFIGIISFYFLYRFI